MIAVDATPHEELIAELMNPNIPKNEREHAGYAISQYPQPVGYWVLYPQVAPTTMFSMYHKPTDEQIKNTEHLLGWQWRDA